VFLDRHHENNPAFVPPANPADTQAIDVIANGDFSEEPQKLGLHWHGDPCMASISAKLSSQATAAAIPLFNRSADRIRSSIRNDLAGWDSSFIDPTK
jgi:hypothetical protein